MRLGVPKEIINGESRVGMTEKGVKRLTELGHEVYICTGAGENSGISDEMYQEAGGIIVNGIKNIYSLSELIIKVNPPIGEELNWVKEGQIVFSYILPEKNEELTRVFLRKKAIAIAYEGVTDSKGKKTLLIPMSEIAGRMAVLMGSMFLQKVQEGKGVMLGAIPGISPAEVVILGAGNAAYSAAEIALGIGCNVTIFDKSIHRLRELKSKLRKSAAYLNFTNEKLAQQLTKVDLLINTIDQIGDKTKHIVTIEMIKKMQKNSVIFDVACDENGTIETSKPTNYIKPTYVVEGIIHCAIPNLPGSVPKTSTFVLTDLTLPYIEKLSEEGFKKAILNDDSLRKGLCIYDGHLLHKQAAQNFGISYSSFEMAF
ncbi:alanine dehydrogenase [Clostridiaceae bacterium 35-E11]